MTLDEAFIKYEDHRKMRRSSSNPRASSYDIYWLKHLKSWANDPSRIVGFLIPESMIEAAIADDWELADEITEGKEE